MRFAIIAVLTLAGCGKPSKCEQYADWQLKCDPVAPEAKAEARKLIVHSCENMASFAQEAECVAQSKDCGEFLACVGALRKPLEK
jgi:hypothetical protein